MYWNAIFIYIFKNNKNYKFLTKNINVSRTQGVVHLIYKIFGSFLGKE